MKALVMNTPRKTSHVIALLLVASLSIPGSAQVVGQLEVNGVCSHFGEMIPSSVITFASDQEAEKAIARIVDTSGLKQNFKVHAAGVPNAAAVIQGQTRYILYNQYFMQNTRQSTNSEWAPLSIMAHEVGHHLNGHTLEQGGSRPPLEIEADYFSGFIMQRLGAKLDDARIAMSRLASDTASATHPAKHDRLAAIANGWTKACQEDSNCNGGSSRPSGTPSRPAKPPPAQDRTDSCEFAKDGECDEPDICDVGTDATDCKAGVTPTPSPTQNLFLLRSNRQKMVPDSS